MSMFFNGRLYVSPATVSVVDDSALRNTNANVGNIMAVIGRAEGGKPFEALRFGSASEARAVLVGGEMLKAIEQAFDASSEVAGPAQVVAVRVDPATRSALALADASAAAAIDLLSEDYGQGTQQIKVKVEAGTLAGKKLTVQRGNDFYVGDNLARSVFSLAYTGVGVATVTISDTQLILLVAAAPVATIELSAFATVQALVDRINTQVSWAAEVLETFGTHPTLASLDKVTAGAISAVAAPVTAHVQAILDWLNSSASPLVSATRGSGLLPVNVGFTYLSGGVTGTPVTDDWQSGFDALQSVDVQWVVPISGDPALHDMTQAHCAFMSNVARKERRGIVGMVTGSTDAQAIAAAKALNDDRMSVVHLGFYDFNAAGNLVLFPPYILAAQLAGAFSGVNPGTALTNKSLKLRGLERKLRNPTDTDQLILGGVLCVEDTPRGYRVVKSISTWLNNLNYNRVEISVGVALDFVSRSVREVLDELRGSKGTPAILAQAVSRVDSVLRGLAVAEPVGPGVLAGDATNPAFKNIKASLEGDILRVEFQCSPVIPVNYIPIVVYAVPYSGTAQG